MTLRLTRLDRNLPIANADGTPNDQFLRLYNRSMESIEEAFNGQAAVQAELAAQLAEIQTVQRTDAISGGWTEPSGVLTAADAGADATITVAAHTRHYGDGTDIAVAGDAITGQPYSTIIAVYYDDTTRADTTPAYVATANIAEAQNNYAPGRHLVGTLTTPAAAGPPSSGGTYPPGSGYGSGGIDIP